jgi:hypothetical protein
VAIYMSIVRTPAAALRSMRGGRRQVAWTDLMVEGLYTVRMKRLPAYGSDLVTCARPPALNTTHSTPH